MPSVSYSEIKLARKCPKAHDYRYRQNLRKKKPKRAPFIGTILHDMLHNWIRSRQIGHWPHDAWQTLEKYEKQYKNLFKGEREEYGDIPATCTAIFEGYLRRWKGDGFTYEDSEVSFCTDLTNEIRLIGVIDKIVVDKHGRRYVMDHKFHKVIPGPEERFADIQTLLYFWGWNQCHSKEKQLDGILWDYGRMKAPTIPEVLKNGELSKRANIDTDVHTYRQAILENGLSEKPYRAFLKTLEGKEHTFFERVPLPAPSKKLVEMVVEDARATAIIHKELSKVGIAPRNMSGFNCKTCDFRALCEAEVRGLDAKFVKARDYIVQERQGDYDGEDEEQAA